MSENNKKVREFYHKFHQDEYIPAKGKVGLTEDVISPERLSLKVDLIAEEFFELVEAVYNTEAADSLRNAYANIYDDHLDSERDLDVVEAADATADLRYVIEGFDIETGIPSDRVFDEVQASNLSKLDEDGNPILSDGTDGHPKGKILKGSHYFRPNIRRVIEAFKKNSKDRDSSES